MKTKKLTTPAAKAAFVFTTAAALLFSSCATIINGPRSKIRIDYSEGTAVTVDGKMLAPGAHAVKVRSKKSHTVVMKKEGYKTITYDIKPQRKTTGLLNIPTGILASIPFMINIGDNKDGGQGTRAGIAMGVLFLAPLALYTVDWISGSGFKSFPRQVQFIPVKLPPSSTGSGQYPIGCTDVNIRMKIGDKIGSVTKKGEKISEIKWENTVNVKVEELEVIVNNGLKDLGFNVPKEVGGRGFTLNAEVSAIDLNKDMSGWDYQMSCKLSTRWTLTDVFTNAVVKTQTIESVNTEQTKDINTIFFSAFENSFLTFLADNPVTYGSVSRQAPKATESSNLEEIALPVPKTNEKETVPDFLKSVVTLEGDDNGHGSGFLISEDGYILTNYHVVKNSKKINVILHGGLSFIGDVLRSDPTNDVALVKLSGSGFKAMKLAEKDSEAQIGDEVYAIGTPADKNLPQTVTKGIISGNRLISDIAYLQSDVSVSPGSSGGPMINKNGLVLGIITSKVVNRGVEGISFALPAAKALEALKLRYK